ncbi:MAG: L-threonine 3-dehydrogenase [Candidatus Thermofonsia Clade 1 bacterium]|uniref:L-threonine 3-dehydrogenase n=1 Tax=Candidatus Thermofonsia Clade 1 bacterium TaxID=2364210 RepID=A0A2M8PBG2_9CHLR|nr:MAG: L-threonine 3-dehydrogenase [Candidatus Thermofonsia Clade 1 bacterium]RMF49704.1 MAG: L-threonine 3-dehydrogenase [Chloroflexota bacterium]
MDFPTKMKAILKAERGLGLRYVEDYPVPRLKHGEVLVKVQAGSICGTDIHIYKWDEWAQRRLKPPFVVGHEIAGTVVACSPEIEHIAIGDQVSLESHVVCNTCYFCRTGRAHLCEKTQIIGVDRDGGFAEYIAIPAQNVWKNPPEMPLTLAVIQENLGNAVHTVMAQDVSAKFVLVTGCGPVGLMAIAVAKAAGARAVIATDISPYRLNLARRMGADRVVDVRHEDLAAAIHACTHGEGVDVLLEMSGAPSAIDQGFAALKEGGEAALLGLAPGAFTFDLNAHVVFKGAIVRGIVGRRLWETWYQARGLLESGALKLDGLVTHTFPMGDFEQAYHTFMSGQSGKIMLIP